ncbi:hypothetical protein RIF29_30957 [Crotalaria pallida]|uniref:Uncharacterized protein n=1 Tax=Crotalaria pallida TaxID=3830 RepID=A0AAN9EJ33_CROPI
MEKSQTVGFTEEEEAILDIPDFDEENGTNDDAWLIGKVLTEGSINTRAFKNTIAAIWKQVSGENVDNSIVSTGPDICKEIENVLVPEDFSKKCNLSIEGDNIGEKGNKVAITDTGVDLIHESENKVLEEGTHPLSDASDEIASQKSDDPFAIITTEGGLEKAIEQAPSVKEGQSQSSKKWKRLAKKAKDLEPAQSNGSNDLHQKRKGGVDPSEYQDMELDVHLPLKKILIPKSAEAVDQPCRRQ